MSEKVYNWKRFWCNREAGFNLGDDGFLVDPDSEYGRVYNPNLLSSQDLISKPCLVLLGEPGIGKSYEINAFQQSTISQLATDQDILPFDLRAFSSDSLLYTSIFEDEKFKRWLNGTHYLYLFLDSLDECLLRINSVASFLEFQLSKYPLDRLFFRIACRTAEWPHSFEKALREFYSEENIAIHELVPLRRKDVKNAVTIEGISNADQFVDALIKNNAVPLAIKPVTLKMLIRLYIRDGAFPSKQIDLYEEGCRLMCEEPSEHRREVEQGDRYSANELLAVSSRIAAVTQFANRYAIWTDIDQANVPLEGVKISQLAGGTENVGGQNITVTPDLVKATIQTGLFTSRGAYRMGWAHQTYAEFLAARYVLKCSMTEKQIMSLLVHPVGKEQKLIPQLYETAAWVANNDVNIFERIMECDPEVLLRSDIASFETEHKSRLVDRLLTLFEQEKLLDRDTYQYYHKLNHQSLANKVRPYICDKSKGWLGRRVAIKIAEVCRIKEVLPELVEVALDQNQGISVRVNAACAVARIGDPEVRAKLKPLALGQGGDDPDDRLKGYALKACWPEHLTADELFQVLTPPKNPDLIGSYDTFMWDLPGKLEATLKPEDLRYGLKWVAMSSGKDWEYKSRFEKTEEWVMLSGWQNLLETPMLAEPFARAAMARLSKFEPIAIGIKESPFSDVIKSDHERRRVVLGTLLSLSEVDEEKLSPIILWNTPVATGEDIPWLIQQYDQVSVEERRKIAKLIGLVFRYDESKYLDEVLEAMRKFPDLEAELSWLKPVEINSPQGRKLKAQYLKHKRLEKRFADRRNRPLLTPSPKERVLNLLDRFEAGEPNAWWWLNREMTLKPDSEYYGDEFDFDITQLPVWNEADDDMRRRIINAARQYVLHPPDMDTSWVGTNTINRPYMAGYRALALLVNKDMEFVNRLPESVWKIWAPILLAYPLNVPVDEEPHRSLVIMAYQKVPEEIIKYLMVLIEKENREGDYIHITRRIEHCLDDRLDTALFEKMKCGDMKPTCMGELADILIGHNYRPAIEYVRAELGKPIPKEGIQHERIIAIAESLLANCPNEGFDFVWPVIESDTKFGLEIFEKFVRLYRHDKVGTFAKSLNERQVAKLYIWLVKQYPYEEDPQYQGAHAVGFRESVAHFRNSLLEHLKNRGTLESLQEIHQIAREMPHLGWLKWTILEAEKNTRAKTWRPLTPEQIIRLAQDSQRTFVEDGRQLLEVICESLDRLEKKLHDELPAVNDLWDNRGKSRQPAWFPKDEGYLSDYITRHLKDDLSLQRGIIVNREVQIQRGQETDIHIDAVNPSMSGGVDIIRAIIEVKGCWNQELETAMETQLVGKYLQENQCPNGLYLVGWFMCDKWNDEDYRKKRTPKYSIEEARKHFAEQAETIAEYEDIPNLSLRAFILDARLS